MFGYLEMFCCLRFSFWKTRIVGYDLHWAGSKTLNKFWWRHALCCLIAPSYIPVFTIKHLSYSQVSHSCTIRHGTFPRWLNLVWKKKNPISCVTVEQLRFQVSWLLYKAIDGQGNPKWIKVAPFNLNNIQEVQHLESSFFDKHYFFLQVSEMFCQAPRKEQRFKTGKNGKTLHCDFNLTLKSQTVDFKMQPHLPSTFLKTKTYSPVLTWHWFAEVSSEQWKF